jgi:hypothetical protein
MLCDAGFELTSIRLLKNFPFDMLSSNIDYLTANSGLKRFGFHIIVHAIKLVTR